MEFKNKTLAVFGDSIMYGSGNDGFGVGEYLKKDMGFKLIKYCVGGARVGYCEEKNWFIIQVRKAVRDNIVPDYIVFDGFTNDCYKTDGVNFDVPLGNIPSAVQDIFDITWQDDFSTCFESAVCAFKKYFPKAKIIFVRPHKMGRREEEAQRIYGERAVALCKKHSVAVADIYEESGLDTFLAEHRDRYTNDSYSWGKGDCTHPNAIGYEKFYMPIIEKKIKELK
ncbi:MAG: SGNH/GDSL hydrolase family protein [Clostridia bacterium]|nr:SGNH/GDSL hydrolase family protein [Clostridia bacterium]